MKIKTEWAKESKLNKDEYLSMYKESIEDNDNFWKKQAQRIDWIKKFNKIKNVKYSKQDVNIKWFEDGSLNVSYNCIDRHAKTKPDDIAIIWEGDDPENTIKITYKDLLKNVCKTANVLKKLELEKEIELLFILL